MLLGHVFLFLNIFAQIKQGEAWSGSVSELSGHNDVAFAFGIVALKFPVTFAVTIVTAAAIVLLNEMLATFGALLAEERAKEVKAVGNGGFGQFYAGERGEAGARSMVQTISSDTCGWILPGQ